MSDAPPSPPRLVHQGAVLARGAFFNTLAFLASNLRGIFTFLVARLLGSAVLGMFGLAWAATDLTSKLGTCGLDTGAITHVARRERVGDAAGGRRIMRAALLIGVGTSLVLALAGFLFTEPIGRHFGERPDQLRAIAVTLLALPGVALYRISNALSRGKSVMHHDIYSRGFTESFGTAAALLIAFALGARALAPEFAAIAGTLASGLVAFVLARRLFIATPSGHGAPGEVRSLLRDSLPIALYDLLNIGVMQIDVIMLGLFVGRVPSVTLETLGIYAAGVEAASGLRKVNQAFSPIFIPMVAQHMAAGEIREAEASYGYLARWMLAVLLPAVAVFVLAGGAILRIYGPSFAQGAVWIAVVGVACALNAFVGLGETILMVERPTINLANSAVACAAVIAANLYLIPRYGPLGAALGMLVPYTIHGVLRGVEISWIFHWRWPWRALAKPWLAAAAAVPLALALRLTRGGVVMELASAAIYVGGYLAAWRAIGLDPSDRAVLDHLLHRRRGAGAAP